jgi:hypothetical protein
MTESESRLWVKPVSIPSEEKLEEILRIAKRPAEPLPDLGPKVSERTTRNLDPMFM